MKLQSARVLFLSPRLAAIVLAIAAITGCSMSTPTSTSEEGSNTSGPYATNQQAVKGSGVACPARGQGVQYLLCLEHSITVKFFAPPGNVTMSTAGCVGVPAHSGSLGFSAIDQEFPVKISGKAEDDKVKCTFEGQTTLTVNSSGECSGSKTGGVENLTIKEKWGIADAQLKCECKGEVDCHPYNGPVQLAGLGDQQITFDFLLTSTEDCKTLPISGGIINGQLKYCFQDALYVPIVPLVP